MSAELNVSGIIIKTMPIGEYDKRLTILTYEEGKINAFVKGARRQGSLFMGKTQNFICADFVVYEGRNSNNIKSLFVKDYFAQLMTDFESNIYAQYFCELADYYCQEYMREPELLSLLYLSLKHLCDKKIPAKLIRIIYELRCMVIDGHYENSPSDLENEAAIYTWKYICNVPIKKLFNFTISDGIYDILNEKIKTAQSLNIEKKIKSFEILSDLGL